VLDDAVRRGLSGEPATRRYRTPSRGMGLRAGFDIDEVLALVAADEDAEAVRKLALRKRGSWLSTSSSTRSMSRPQVRRLEGQRGPKRHSDELSASDNVRADTRTAVPVRQVRVVNPPGRPWPPTASVIPSYTSCHKDSNIRF
jgi:hypothetical protein